MLKGCQSRLNDNCHCCGCPLAHRHTAAASKRCAKATALKWADNHLDEVSRHYVFPAHLLLLRNAALLAQQDHLAVIDLVVVPASSKLHKQVKRLKPHTPFGSTACVLQLIQMCIDSCS